eukprot:5942865-Pleurochrysis_carterae.AAC.1
MARWHFTTRTSSFLLSGSILPTNRTLDDHVWVATFDENWGVDLWPALFTQAGEPDLSTMTQNSELIRTLLQNMESDASSLDKNRVMDILT